MRYDDNQSLQDLRAEAERDYEANEARFLSCSNEQREIDNARYDGGDDD